jgi:hypothetical protein
MDWRQASCSGPGASLAPGRGGGRGSIGRCPKVGTACSGTDIVMGALSTLTDLLNTLDISVHFDHVFAADIKDSCREFITLNWSPKALVALGGS